MRNLSLTVPLLTAPYLRASLLGAMALGFGAFTSPAISQEGDDASEPTQAEIAAIDEEQEVHDTAHFPLKKPELLNWSFAGIFGRYDLPQLQRGFQVYREVCASCHGLEYVAFRNFQGHGGLGYSEAEVKALAAEYQITAGPNDEGDMFERPGIPADRFPSPFPNVQAAAAANGGAAPPDLSLMAKARGASRGPVWTVLDFFTQYQEAGPDYIHALLTGYGEEPPHGLEVAEGTYYNPYFLAGASLAMPPPLSDGIVTYSDGSPETIDQYSRDVSAFLMWAAEPHLVERKRLGFQVGIFLIVFAGLMYLTKKRVWAREAH
ncbi:cytochrome c1 [Bauldia litoralis]|uniref:Cytochrome c1 n=1 Tax=Bauldia litoralis TaxID=665467 RepID=A0A1G6DS76_9HYPH|nr:cytochrome c1 [Bauldia litoralis]SDB47645.1 ubiquinol-cytochrome c reductase cytochrome c1 subunit [Bauldia litoralis]